MSNLQQTLVTCMYLALSFVTNAQPGAPPRCQQTGKLLDMSLFSNSMPKSTFATAPPFQTNGGADQDSAYNISNTSKAHCDSVAHPNMAPQTQSVVIQASC